VGNEEYGSWETDLHANPHDPSTYAAAVTGANGYYSLIKAQSPNTLVGVVVDADANNGCCAAGWDSTVLGNAVGSYDFVEFHFYPQNPGGESDSFLVTQAAQVFTQNIGTLKTELQTAGKPDTPIYVGEMGSVSSNPGKQSVSITQGLFAGQMLGEMMNDGISRATWWIGFGNCNGTAGNDSSSLYGWQDFGAYNVFSDGSIDSTCPGYGSIGTMSPTAQAFNLFQNVAVTGEHVLTPTLTGDAGPTSDVRVYAATHSGGTALVLFNVNETTSETVQVTVDGEGSSPDVKVITYDKSIYDQTDAAAPVWAAPTTTDMGTQAIPLTLTLSPWSMNVVLIQ
jgi:alpha-L-arabinofuranosidase